MGTAAAAGGALARSLSGTESGERISGLTLTKPTATASVTAIATVEGTSKEALDAEGSQEQAASFFEGHTEWPFTPGAATERAGKLNRYNTVLRVRRLAFRPASLTCL
jgi:hypothetical protein